MPRHSSRETSEVFARRSFNSPHLGIDDHGVEPDPMSFSRSSIEIIGALVGRGFFAQASPPLVRSCKPNVLPELRET